MQLRSHKILHATTKTWCRQTNKYFKEGKWVKGGVRVSPVSLWFSGGLMDSVANKMGTKVMVRLVRDSFG